MKNKSYKIWITIAAICFFGTAFGQKFDEKFTEKFIVNKDVEVTINASNSEINVTTWSKNEIQVEAFIEVEGISKIEAEKYFKNWNFEALGNKNKVKINAQGNTSFDFKNDFVFFNNMNFEIPEIEIEKSSIEAIFLPKINFDFKFDYNNLFNGVKDLDDLEKTIGKNGDYSFAWKDDEYDIEINTKEEWEAFKKTKEYKKLKILMKKEKEKVRKELERSKDEIRKEFEESKDKMRKEFEESKNKYYNIDKEKIKNEFAKAKEKLKKLNYSLGNGDFIINGKKVKINKRLEIKVPKGATFDLNTRHCKVKLPKTKASGKVSYGTFNADELNGGELKIYSSPATINSLNSSILFLNNVTDAKVVSVANSSITSSSGDLIISKVFNDVNIDLSFGDISILNFDSSIEKFVMNLKQSEAEINIGSFGDRIKILSSDVAYSKKKQLSNLKLGESYTLKGSFKIGGKEDKLKISGKYSTITFMK